MLFEENISINDKDKMRLSLILHGTSGYPGCRISLLDFGSKEKKDHEIERFIQLVNYNYRDLFRVIRTDDFIVPVISNRGSMDHSFNNMSAPSVALSCLILFHFFEYEKGPTIAKLTELSEGTPLHGKIKSSISELKSQRWVKEENEQNTLYISPTNIMFACISFETLKRVYQTIYRDRQERPKLIRFLSPNYRKIQQQLGINLTMETVQQTLADVIPKKVDEDE